MDMSPWLCGECDCQEIAFDLSACPQCAAPKAQGTAPAKKTTATKTARE